VVDIGAWWRDPGLERYEQAVQENGMDAEILAKLTTDDITAEGGWRLLA
jgi:hypothetical protein